MFYVYKLINPNDGSPFYVGKGKGNRCNHHFRNKLKGNTSKNVFSTIKMLYSQGFTKDDILVIDKYFDNEEDAYDYESDQIILFGQIHNHTGILFNKIISHLNFRSSWKGKKHSPETIKKMSKSCPEKANFGEKNGFFGKKHTKETIDKIKISNSKFHKGRPKSEETKKRMKGKKSIEHTEILRKQALKNLSDPIFKEKSRLSTIRRNKEKRKNTINRDLNGYIQIINYIDSGLTNREILKLNTYCKLIFTAQEIRKIKSNISLFKEAVLEIQNDSKK